MTSYTTVGRAVTRLEGPQKVTGSALYPADVHVPGMLWGKALRSPLPHARIVNVYTSQASRLPGVHAVLTGADLSGIRIGRRMLDLPVLAWDKVRFIGQKVAAVAAEDPDIAEDALELIEVEYAELPAVFDPQEAMLPGAPILHENINSYKGLPEPVQEPTNRFVHNLWSKGDIERGFAEADMLFEHTFTLPRTHQIYLEPHACLVQVDDAGRVQVWVNSKVPFPLRNQIAAAIGLEPDRVRINVSRIGGDFGGKGDPMDVPLSYFLARASGRPVKMVMTFLEELTAGNPRHPATIMIRSGVKMDGSIVARQASVVFNSGAYGAFKPGPGVNLLGASGLGGSYRIPNVHIESDMVYTNTVPGGFMRAPGAPQAVFAVESHMDIIASEMGMEPLDLRRRNLLQEGDDTPTGQPLRQVRSDETLDAAVKAIGWDSSKPGPNTGMGIALYDRPTGGAESSATVIVESDGTVTLRSPTPDVGTGTHTVLSQIIAEELSIPLDDINVVTIDTDSGPFDAGVAGSWVTHSAGQATLQATQQVRQRLIDVAAGLLSSSQEEVRLNSGRFLASAGGAGISLADVAAEAPRTGEPVTAQVTYRPEGGRDITSFCAQIAEVEVDPETGQIRVRRFVSAHDVGTIINPLGHQGQIEGGIIQGLGYVLMEELRVEEGQVTTAHLGDYKIPTIQDIPELITALIEEPAGPTPLPGQGHRRDQQLPRGCRHSQRRLRCRWCAHHRPAHHCREGAGGPEGQGVVLAWRFVDYGSQDDPGVGCG